jgi:ABC-type Fe3+-hydroxamate transport system substrate-binding protein
VATPSPPANLHREIGQRRHGQPSNPARAHHLISAVHLGYDDLASIKPDLILAVRWRSGRSDPPPHLRSAIGPGWSVHLARRSLAPLAHLSTRARVRAYARLLRSNPGC